MVYIYTIQRIKQPFMQYKYNPKSRKLNRIKIQYINMMSLT